MKKKEVQHFIKKLKPKAWLSACPLKNYTGEAGVVMDTGDRFVTSRLIKSILKYGTSVIPGGKYFIAKYCRTAIIKSTGISFRNKTMADNHRLF